VGQLQSLLERLRPHHGEHRPENFFLCQSMRRLDVRNHGRSDHITGSFGRPIDHDPPFTPTECNIVLNPPVRSPVDHRTDVNAGIVRRTDAEAQDRVGQPSHKLVMHPVQQDHP